MRSQHLVRIISPIIALGLGLVACHPGGDGDPSEELAKLDQSLAARDVTLVAPELREEQPTLDLVGEIQAFDTVKVSTEVVGNVDRVLVRVGDRVTAGQPMIEVDRSTYQLRLDQADANVAAAEAQLDLATKELERKRDLLSDNTIAQAVFDQAEAGHQLAKAQLAAARATRNLAQRDFERSIICAPAAGSVAVRHAVAGQWADINAPLVELAVGSSLKVVGRVPEAWAPNLSGLAGFQFRVGTGEWRRADLYSIDPVVSQASRSFEVVGTAANDGAAIRPGMFATVRLTSPTVVRSLWLPAEAVSTADMSEVMLVENDAIVVREIQKGRRANGSIEIVAGLEPGERVVSRVAGLARGFAVRVVGESGGS